MSEMRQKYSKEIIASDIYKRWRGIFSRCQKGSSSRGFKHYAGKGISVCSEWSDFYVFKEWAEKNGFRKDLTIDRIDASKGYSPENCQWITRRENSRKITPYLGHRNWLVKDSKGRYISKKQGKES